MGVPRPNILLVSLDSARADHLSCHGYARETTPILDRVAHEGVRFGRAFATAASTLPAHASLFSGLYPSTHGATEEHPRLSPRWRLLPEYLKSAGYRTAAFCASRWLGPETGFGPGLDHFDTQQPPASALRRAQLYWRRARGRLLRRQESTAARINDRLLQWVRASGEPFFAFVHYGEIPTPLALSPPCDRTSSLAMPGAGTFPRQGSAKAVPAGATDAPDDRQNTASAVHDGKLRRADASLGDLIAALQHLGEWDRTLFVLTADHGEELGEHGVTGHGLSLYDSMLWIPLIIRWPDRVPAGFVVEELAQTLDILPTILSLVGVEEVDPMPGRPLLSEGRATPGPEFIIAERYRSNSGSVRGRELPQDHASASVREKAIRTKREKFVWRSDEDNQLFDLIRDPRETRNLIDQDPYRAEALRALLFHWFSTLDRFEDLPSSGELHQSAGEAPPHRAASQRP